MSGHAFGAHSGGDPSRAEYPAIEGRLVEEGGAEAWLQLLRAKVGGGGDAMGSLPDTCHLRAMQHWPRPWTNSDALSPRDRDMYSIFLYQLRPKILVPMKPIHMCIYLGSTRRVMI